MKKLSFEETFYLLMDSHLFQDKRQPQDSNDWGDEQTVGLHLKRHGATPLNGWNDFGIYLGKHETQYIVAIFKDYITIGEGESFDSIEEMKEQWQLD